MLRVEHSLTIDLVAPLIQEVVPEQKSEVGDLTMGNLEINDYSQSLIEFNEKEQSIMRSLPNKECKY